MIKITLPDNSIREFKKGITPIEIAQSISEGLARNVLSANIDDKISDLNSIITNDCKLKLNTWDDKDGKHTFWHSSAHLMASAIQSLYPNCKLTIGPAIENGFYYDIDFKDYIINDKDFEKIESKMMEIVKYKNEFDKAYISKSEVSKIFENNEYKLELIDNLEDGQISIYKMGDFVDLCSGPHLPDTSFIKAVKIMSLAGAYWRGDEKNKQLTRLYGISFPKQSALKEYLLMIEEAKKRDHRKLGKELKLFTFSQNVGMGLPLWLPKGTLLRESLINFLKKAQDKLGYDQVITPHIGHKNLYITSGHYEKYGKDSFQPIHTPQQDEEFLLKPMNCPHHCEIYKSEPRSYKDLPLRLAEFGTVYRYEQSGELHGLTRVRGFTQDDAHIFCTAEQVEIEFKKVIDLVIYVFNALGFTEYTAQISLRDLKDKSKYLGDEKLWENAENSIIKVSNEAGLKTVVEYGEAAFYGPKLDFMVKDALGRSWQLGTIQLDYNLPIKFELEYTGADNQKHRPVMIHRAPFGSLERFLAVLIEHCEGKFPLWLTPEQVKILPISDKYNDHSLEIKNILKTNGIRASVDDRNEKIGKKIRDTEVEKIPFMIIIGEKEMLSSKLSIRKQGEGDLGEYTINEFSELIEKEINLFVNN